MVGIVGALSSPYFCKIIHALTFLNNLVMNAKNVLLILGLASIAQIGVAHDVDSAKNDKEKTEENSKAKKSKFTLGGYGEAVMTRNFFSDKYLRYTDAKTYKDDKSHGRFDLPHVTLWMGYDFGKGWSVGTEIEFDHGGTESAIEIEPE